MTTETLPIEVRLATLSARMVDLEQKLTDALDEEDQAKAALDAAREVTAAANERVFVAMAKRQPHELRFVTTQMRDAEAMHRDALEAEGVVRARRGEAMARVRDLRQSIAAANIAKRDVVREVERAARAAAAGVQLDASLGITPSSSTRHRGVLGRLIGRN